MVDYERQFMKLTRYAPDKVTTDERKIEKIRGMIEFRGFRECLLDQLIKERLNRKFEESKR